VPPGERAELTRAAAAHFGVSERTIQRRVARFWPVAVEPQEPGGLHRITCPGPTACICDEVILI
jgi:predicted DNA-binding transcriptional regulator YafY